MKLTPMTLGLIAALLIVGSAVSGADASGASLSVESRRPVLLAGPTTRPIDWKISGRTAPYLLSIRVGSERTAWDLYHEAVRNGEGVCLNDLGVGIGGERFWLHSC